jgi:hypothetical protein
MSPMSLLSLPASTLREMEHVQREGTCGGRSERRVALAVATIAGVLGALLGAGVLFLR